jgi:hypothetical protein
MLAYLNLLFFFCDSYLRLCLPPRKKVLCKQKISRHIKLAIHAWSTKYR